MPLMHTPGKRLALLIAATAMFPFGAGAASVLDPSQQGLAAMMGGAEVDTLFLNFQFGPSDTPVPFTGNFTPNSFSYNSNPGSLYRGAAQSFTSSGVQSLPNF